MCQIPVLLLMVVMGVVVVVGVVGVAWGAAPCCYPAKWEATVNGFNLFFNAGKFQSLIRSTTVYSYDFTNMRVNEFMTETNVKGEHTFLQILTLFKDKMQYTIKNQQKCSKLPFDDTIPMFNCIPAFANSSGSLRYGVNSTVEGTEWNWNFDGSMYQSLSVTDQCYPIVQTWTGFEMGNPEADFAEYVNITRGIKDTAVFDIPQQCQNAQVDSQSRVRRMFIH